MGRYLEKIKLYLHDMINNFESSEKRKIQLTIKPKFMLLTYSNEKRTLHTKSHKLLSAKQQMKFDSLLDICQDVWYNLWKVAIFYLTMSMVYITRVMRHASDMVDHT